MSRLEPVPTVSKASCAFAALSALTLVPVFITMAFLKVAGVIDVGWMWVATPLWLGIVATGLLSLVAWAATRPLKK